MGEWGSVLVVWFTFYSFGILLFELQSQLGLLLYQLQQNGMLLWARLN